MSVAQTTAAAGPMIGSPRASIDFDPYVSQLRKWLDSANEVTALEQMKQLLQAIMRMIERLIARLCHLFGVGYYGLRQGLRGEVMDIKTLDPTAAEPIDAVVDRGSLKSVAFTEALEAVDRQIRHLVGHVVSGDAHRAGDYADPDKLDAILQDLARSRQDFGHLANRAKGDVDRLMPQVTDFIKATGGNADPKVVMAILSKGLSDPQARIVDPSGHLVKAIADHGMATERVRSMEIAAHALIEQAGKESPALQARMRARALELMPGALEFLSQKEASAQGDGEVSSAQGEVSQENPIARESSAYILSARNEHATQGGDVSAKLDDGAKVIAPTKSGFARFAKHVDLSKLAEVEMPDESVFDAPVPVSQRREAERERL